MAWVIVHLALDIRFTRAHHNIIPERPGGARTLLGAPGLTTRSKSFTRLDQFPFVRISPFSHLEVSELKGFSSCHLLTKKRLKRRPNSKRPGPGFEHIFMPLGFALQTQFDIGSVLPTTWTRLFMPRSMSDSGCQ